MCLEKQHRVLQRYIYAKIVLSTSPARLELMEIGGGSLKMRRELILHPDGTRAA